MNKITPCLWYDGKAEEAARFYTTLLPGSHMGRIHRAPMDNPSGSEGSVMFVEFTLAGMSFVGLNAGPQFPFTEAVSFQIETHDQQETDRLTDALIANGGSEGQCGWLKDRWGMSWQIVPNRLMELITSASPDVARRVGQAMMQMHRINIGVLEAAARNETADA